MLLSVTTQAAAAGPPPANVCGGSRSGADELALGAQPVRHRVAVAAREVQLVGAQRDLLVRHRRRRARAAARRRGLHGPADPLGRGRLRGRVLRHGVRAPLGRVCGYGSDGPRAARPRRGIRAGARNSCAHGYGADAMAGELDPARALADLRALRRLTGDERGAQRVAWTDTWARARDWLRERVAELPGDVEVATDEAGNLWVTLAGARPDTVVLGSHLDSVPDGGWLDGALGVLGGLEVLRTIAARGAPPVTVALVDWADEEGARFGRSLLGSSLATGALGPATLRDVHDRDGVTLPDALAAHGVDLDAAPGARARLDRAAAYLELHIEQGPVLEREHLAVRV